VCRRNTKWIRPFVRPPRPPRNKRRCPLQPAESLLARARAPPAARSDSVDVRARRPSPLLPAGPCSATPPALRLLPCAPLDVGRKDRFPLGTRLREDRARVVNAARARSLFPGTPVAVTWDPRLKTSLKQRERRRCSSSRRRSAHRDKLGAPFSPPPPPPPRPSPPSPPPSISRRRPSDGAGASLWSLAGASPLPPSRRRSARGRRLPCQSRRPHNRCHRLAPRRRRHRPLPRR
jgi:hypothetical protein